MDEIEFDLAQMENTVVWETSWVKKKFPTSMFKQ